jgi:hypothetical protein
MRAHGSAAIDSAGIALARSLLVHDALRLELHAGAGECFKLVLVSPALTFLPAITDEQQPPLLFAYSTILAAALIIAAAWTLIDGRSRRPV